MADQYNGYGDDDPVTYAEVQAALADADPAVRSMARAVLDDIDSREAAARPQPQTRSERFGAFLAEKLDAAIAESEQR